MGKRQAEGRLLAGRGRGEAALCHGPHSCLRGQVAPPSPHTSPSGALRPHTHEPPDFKMAGEAGKTGTLIKDGRQPASLPPSSACCHAAPALLREARMRGGALAPPPLWSAVSAALPAGAGRCGGSSSASKSAAELWSGA